jgi:hypothetical protein
LLKRAETIPSLPLDDQQPVEAITAVIAPPVLYLKPVHSLRKSEQVRLPVMPPVAPAANTNLPSQRHNNQDLQKIRRREALALPPLIANPKLVAAHPALLIPGYLSVLIGAAAFCFYQQPIAVSAPCAGVSLLIATFIALKQPLSRHHAAFIAVITLFVIVFGALHYFPQLRHAT